MWPNSTALAAAILVGGLTVAFLLLGSDIRQERRPEAKLGESPSAANLLPVVLQLRDWNLAVGLVIQPRDWRCFSQPSPMRWADTDAVRHDVAAALLIKWLKGEARRRLRQSFDAFVEDGRTRSWETLKEALVAYEISLAFAIQEVRASIPPVAAMLLKLPRMGWLKPLMTEMVPPRSGPQTDYVLEVIRESDDLVDDLRKANRRLSAFHKLSCGLDLYK